MGFHPFRSHLAGGKMSKAAPQKRLPVVAAISIFYNGLRGTGLRLERANVHAISMKSPTAVKDSVDPLVMTRCAAR
jgi:hypothetical protein